MEYFKPKKVNLKSTKGINETWIQQIIADDPSVLGIGDVIVKDKERNQPRAGRLDLLLQDAESNRRYEVEIQLGKTDESHIIRTIEYWDIERKRYPQYDHVAVIVAEEITARFFNVISLFNGFIPLIALQMSAYEFGDKLGLIFTKVLDELPLGLVDEDEETQEVTDRGYWLNRGTKETVKIADEMLNLIHQFKEGYDLKYNKFYIGLVKDGQPNNFAIFRPKKNYTRFEFKSEKDEEIDKIIEDANLDEMGYDSRWKNYRIRLIKEDVKNKKESLMKLLRLADKYLNG